MHNIKFPWQKKTSEDGRHNSIWSLRVSSYIFLVCRTQIKRSTASFSKLCNDETFFCICIDDILVASETEVGPENCLRTVSERLCAHGLCINIVKCVLGAAEVAFLDYHISSKGSSSLPQRIPALQDFKKPEIDGIMMFFRGD